MNHPLTDREIVSLVLNKPFFNRRLVADCIERLISENEKLREALNPFAEIADEFGSEYGDESRFARGINYAISMGDLRRARAALSVSGEGNKEGTP